MPPRKRAEAKPEDPEQTTVPAPAPAPAAPVDTPPADPGGATPPPENRDEPPVDKPKAPEKSDLQDVEQPCVECFPNGWTEGAFSQGCEHGTWVRKQS
jgi:hypothetical protein